MSRALDGIIAIVVVYNSKGGYIRNSSINHSKNFAVSSLMWRDKTLRDVMCRGKMFSYRPWFSDNSAINTHVFNFCRKHIRQFKCTP